MSIYTMREIKFGYRYWSDAQRSWFLIQDAHRKIGMIDKANAAQSMAKMAFWHMEQHRIEWIKALDERRN